MDRPDHHDTNDAGAPRRWRSLPVRYGRLGSLLVRLGFLRGYRMVPDDARAIALQATRRTAPRIAHITDTFGVQYSADAVEKARRLLAYVDDDPVVASYGYLREITAMGEPMVNEEPGPVAVVQLAPELTVRMSENNLVIVEILHEIAGSAVHYTWEPAS